MVGVDIVEISRFKDDFFLLSKRLLSEEEKNELDTRKGEENRLSYLAGRFASKEAYIKAVGDRTLEFKDISIIDDSTGKPHIYYKGKEAGEISISHDKFAVAFVIVKPDQAL